MLNEDKIKLMTELALYEQKEKKALDETRRYFKSDYVARHLLQSFFGFTLSYLLVLLLVVLYNIQKILEIIVIFDFVPLFRNVLLFYFVGLIIFELITVKVYSGRYHRMKEKSEEYVLRLTRLSKRYDFLNRSKELAKEDNNA